MRPGVGVVPSARLPPVNLATLLLDCGGAEQQLPLSARIGPSELAAQDLAEQWM